MNKRLVHSKLKMLKSVSYWYFLIAFIIFGLTAVMSLRQNNLNAIKLRDVLIKTDEQNGDTEKALKDLRGYIYAHMNTGLASKTSVYPPIQLKYSYDRLVAAEKARVQQANTDIYNDAQKYCEANFPQSFYGAGRLPCIKNYIDTHPQKNATEQPIPDALYKFDFASPVWSPDLAGWSIVLSGLFLGIFVLQIGTEYWMRYELKKRI